MVFITDPNSYNKDDIVRPVLRYLTIFIALAEIVPSPSLSNRLKAFLISFILAAENLESMSGSSRETGGRLKRSPGQCYFQPGTRQVLLWGETLRARSLELRGREEKESYHTFDNSIYNGNQYNTIRNN